MTIKEQFIDALQNSEVFAAMDGEKKRAILIKFINAPDDVYRIAINELSAAEIRLRESRAKANAIAANTAVEIHIEMKKIKHAELVDEENMEMAVASTEADNLLKAIDKVTSVKEKKKKFLGIF